MVPDPPPEDGTDPTCDQSESDDRPQDPSLDGDSTVVVEFEVDASAFALPDALDEHPGAQVECERSVPTTDVPSPYLWTKARSDGAFHDAIADDSTVADVDATPLTEESALYRIQWSTSPDSVLAYVADGATAVSMLRAAGRDGVWTVELRFPSRDELRDFRAFCDEHGIEPHVLRLYEPSVDQLGRYGLTPKQRRALVRALELGYFEIPREATLSDVAEALDISTRATSERLRRGHANLLAHSLSVGERTGVGVDYS